MKIKMKGGFIEDDASIEGLFDCTMKYEIKHTSAMIDWTGPKIPMEVWSEVLSFFQWCYDTYKSECQVRLYVSPTLRTWKAYAFPQEAKTGMTAREIDNEASRAQRAAIGLNPPDWFYFGTVHHHCSAGAFQSGTDQENEKNQDGLHITIGNMNSKEKYDIHARFYRKGLCLDNDNLDMSWFFETGNLIQQCPEALRQYLPKDLSNKQARILATKIPAEINCPQQWKDNVIDITPPAPVGFQGTPYTPNLPGTSQGSHQTTNVPSVYSPETEPLWKRAQSAWREILFKCVANEVSADDLEQAIGEMCLLNFAPNIVVMACRHHRVDPDDIEREMPMNISEALVEEQLSQDREREEAKRELEREKEKAATTGTAPKTNTSEGNGAAKSEAGGEPPAGGGTENSGPGGTDPDWSHLHNIS